MIKHPAKTQYQRIADFCTKERGNEWFNCGCMRVYLRVRIRYIHQERMRVLDVGSVVIDKQEYRGKGLWKHFESWIAMQAAAGNCDALFIENVMDKRFQDHFRRMPEWKEYETVPGDFACFLLRLKKPLDGEPSHE